MTAVDWLENQISSSKYFYKIMKEIESRGTVAQSNIFHQAKAMEKEQIINAHGLRYSDITEETVNGEDYYNQTYNNENTNGTSIS